MMMSDLPTICLDCSQQTGPDCDESMFYILVTGSRKWHDKDVMRSGLLDLLDEFGVQEDDAVTLIHGGAAGADLMAAEVGRELGFAVERHRANWSAPCGQECFHRPRQRSDGSIYCPLSGHRRNQHMVDLGADVAIAFPTSPRPYNEWGGGGTWDCVRRIEKAGIPLHVIEEQFEQTFEHYRR